MYIIPRGEKTLSLLDDKRIVAKCRSGHSSFDSLLENSENPLAQSEAAVAINLVALYKALGGGW